MIDAVGQKTSGGSAWSRTTRRLTARLAGVTTAAAVASLGTTAAHAQTDDDKLRSLGRRMSGECTSCHRLDAPGGSIPSITGWDVSAFVTTLQFYAKGERTHQAMMSVAQSLDETQMRALALYFSSLPKMSTAARPSTPAK